MSFKKKNEIESLNNNIEGGLYRYQGTNEVVTDNYICFGTSDKDTCINNTIYMYRIIGIDENNQIKLIKKRNLTIKAWHSNKKTDISWAKSDLFKGLNGIDGGYYTDIFVNNSTYGYMNENSNWYNKIAVANWKYGDTTNYGIYNGATIYEIENGWTNTVAAKIGLMYIHDYYYAYAPGGNPNNGDNAKTAWILSGSTEWTMSRYGYFSGGYYSAWVVQKSGVVAGGFSVSEEFVVHPVFYLTSDVERLMGTGTINDPFIIKE